MNKYHTSIVADEMRFVLLSIFFVLMSELSLSQNLTIQGTVRDSKTNELLPFVSIAIKGSYLGTVSNIRGAYKIVIPKKYTNSSVVFSAIGYENQTLDIQKDLRSTNSIFLFPVNYPIHEVVIMPDSTLLQLLRKAYKKIPENYHDYPTRSIGFYRESLKLEDGDYLYLTEAILDSYKTSYENVSGGQVKIIRSRKNVFPGWDTICPVRFYGGVFKPHKADVVKKRIEFLKPSKEYSYKLEGIELLCGREVYCISFYPARSEKEGKVGKFYIDKESLAYVCLNYKSNKEALKWRDKEPLSSLSSVEDHFIRNYENINGRYFLKSSFSNEKVLNKKTGYLLEISDEYITTDINIDSVHQIPYSEQVSYSTIISSVADDYKTTDWKDYTILNNETDSLELMPTYKADSLLSFKHKPSKEDKIQKLARVFSKFEFDLNLIYFPVSIGEGNYSMTLFLPNKYSLSFEDKSNNDFFSFQYESSIKYKLTGNWKLFANASSSIPTSEKSECYMAGVEYSLPLKTYGKKIFLTANVGYGFLKFLKNMGTTKNSAEFTFNETKFASNKIKAYRGITMNGIRLGSDISFQLSNFWHLKLIGGYQFNFNQTEKIRLAEKDGFFLTRKSVEGNLLKEDLGLTFNGEKVISTQFDFRNYYGGIGLSFMF